MWYAHIFGRCTLINTRLFRRNSTLLDISVLDQNSTLIYSHRLYNQIPVLNFLLFTLARTVSQKVTDLYDTKISTNVL